jgi:CRP/FNR family cyclic AMP-dependent transcriptional regulator
MHTQDYTDQMGQTASRQVAADTPILVEYAPKQVIFFQGDIEDHVLHLQSGEVMVTMNTAAGKEAVIGVLTAGAFLGEEVLAGRSRRRVTATAITPCTVQLLPRQQVWQSLQHFHDFRRMFLASVLSRTIRLEQDLADQMLNSAKPRLARALLLMAGASDPDDDVITLPTLSQEVLANMVGTTRARINNFMNEFKKLGALTYDQNGITVNRPRLSAVMESSS